MVNYSISSVDFKKVGKRSVTLNLEHSKRTLELHLETDDNKLFDLDTILFLESPIKEQNKSYIYYESLSFVSSVYS